MLESDLNLASNGIFFTGMDTFFKNLNFGPKIVENSGYCVYVLAKYRETIKCSYAICSSRATYKVNVEVKLNIISVML